jgi:hypothetical protein
MDEKELRRTLMNGVCRADTSASFEADGACF